MTLAAAEPTSTVEEIAEWMFWYVEVEGPLEQMRAWGIIRERDGEQFAYIDPKGSHVIAPEVLRAFKALHRGEVTRVGQVRYLTADIEARRANR